MKDDITCKIKTLEAEIRIYRTVEAMRRQKLQSRMLTLVSLQASFLIVVPVVSLCLRLPALLVLLLPAVSLLLLIPAVWAVLRFHIFRLRGKQYLSLKEYELMMWQKEKHRADELAKVDWDSMSPEAQTAVMMVMFM